MERLTTSVQSFSDSGDLQRVTRLSNDCEALDQVGWGISEEELDADLTSSGIDRARDLRLWDDERGELIGYGEVQLTPSEGYLTGTFFILVSPAWRARGLEQEILEWAQSRIREAAGEQGLPPRLKTFARSDDQWRTRIFAALGAPARFYWRMQRDLTQPLPDVTLPQGYRVRALRGAEDIPAWAEAYNESFVDAWDFHALSVEEAGLYMRSDSFYRRELDLVAETAEGELAAFCLSTINPAENEREARQEGGVRLLGTRRGHRGRGLGRAMLLEALHRLRGEGMDYAWLGVDASSPTGATRLYESVGFAILHTFTTWMVDL